METRSCIAQVIKDINKYGADKKIVVEEMDIIKNGMAFGCLCDYSLFENDIKKHRDSNNSTTIYQSTLYDFVLGNESPLKQARLYSTTALQKQFEIEEIVNKELLSVLKDAEKKFKDYSDDLKKKLNVENQTADYYKQSIANKCRIEIDVNMLECCEQDIYLFEEDRTCDGVFKEIENGKQELIDWIVHPVLFDKSYIELSDDEYFQEISLIEIKNIIINQDNGIYTDVKKAKILKL